MQVSNSTASNVVFRNVNRLVRIFLNSPLF
jgi:hypothetical protein